MSKFEELKKKYDDAVKTYDEIEKEYDAIRYKKISADTALQYAIRDTVTAILEEVTGHNVDLYEGINVRYLGTDGVLIIGKIHSYAVMLEFHKLTKSGKVSEKKEYYIDFYFNHKTGIMMFDEEFSGTPEEVAEFIKTYEKITFK